MTTPAAAPTAMSTGSGILNRHATTRAVAPITRVGTSMMARLARTKQAPAIVPDAAAVTPATKPLTLGLAPAFWRRDPAVEKRHDREAAAEDEGAGLREEPQDLPEHLRRRRHHEARGCRALEPGGRRLRDHRHQAAGHEEPEELRLRPRRDHGHHREDQPLQLVLGHGQLRELVGGDGDDADHGGADAVERGLHPREATEADV